MQLLVHVSARSWTLIWHRVSIDPNFGSDLLLRVAHDYRHRPAFYTSLGERQLADLYIWLERHFPYSAEIHHGGGPHWVGARESVGHLRDGLLRYLVNLAAEASVQELQRVVKTLADRDWLSRQLREAEQTMRMRTWSPLQPDEIIKITESRQGLLVQSAAELGDVLVEALQRYESDLHGEQTPVRALWDRQGNGYFRPIDENGLSDHVRLFLNRELVERGIVLNREVELSRVPAAPIGKRTDIKVDAFRRDENGQRLSTITAIIEMKGCWNAELLSSIQSQLVDDYMARTSAPVGIYVVGWFDKPKWDSKDSRKSSTPDWSIQEAQQHLQSEVKRIPPEFNVIPIVVDCHAP